MDARVLTTRNELRDLGGLLRVGQEGCRIDDSVPRAFEGHCRIGPDRVQACVGTDSQRLDRSEFLLGLPDHRTAEETDFAGIGNDRQLRRDGGFRLLTVPEELADGQHLVEHVPTPSADDPAQLGTCGLWRYGSDVARTDAGETEVDQLRHARVFRSRRRRVFPTDGAEVQESLVQAAGGLGQHAEALSLLIVVPGDYSEDAPGGCYGTRVNGTRGCPYEGHG